MKYIILFILIASASFAQETNYLDSWESDYYLAISKAKQENKPLFIMLTSNNCGWCRKLEADTLSRLDIQSYLNPFIKVQVYGDKNEINKNIYNKLDGRGYPTLIFMDSNEKILNKWSGYKNPVDFALQCAKAYESANISQPDQGFQIDNIQIKIIK